MSEYEKVVTMSNIPEPKFKKGQIVVLKNSKKQLSFRIMDVRWDVSEWFYAWNRRNYAAEHMLRELTEEEAGRHV